MKNLENFSEIKLIPLKEHKDTRGFFSETYNKKFLSEYGVNDDFIQDNKSFSEKKYTLRGLHFQMKPFEQSKLIRVVSGAIFDVFIDLRKNSKNFEQYGAIKLTPECGLLYIPKGFAHGFITLLDNTEVSYKVDNYYNSKSEMGIRWNDTKFYIDWPCKSTEIIISEKDENLPFWSDIKNKINF